MLDVKIRGGTVLDGTGSPARTADVAVRDGKVVGIGPTDEPAARTIDAAGLMVAPGFVDLHTHYDAQLAWDPTASPSPLHGVTTVIGGNCGFSLAPAGPEHADYLMRLMARVEGMPLAALAGGLSWDWDSFADWLGRLEGRLGVNAGFLVGHSALRRVAMGADAVGGPADAGQVEAMVALLHEALAGGALGFSTSQAPTHSDGNGDPVPSRWADRAELSALAGAVSGHAGTTLELILAGCLNGFSDEEVDLMTHLSLTANRPANWNVLGVSSMNPEGHVRQLDASTRAAEKGARVVALTLPHSMGIRLSFLSGAVLEGLPGWGPVMKLAPEEKMRALSDPEVRRRLAEGAASPEAGVLGGLATWHRLLITETFSPENGGAAGRPVGDVARERGVEPFDALLDVVVADGLRTGIRPPMPKETDEDWRLRAEVWRDPRTVVGGSDAGAHLDMMCGAVYSTALLASVRDHQTLTWEEAARQLADVPARLYGLTGRGRLEPGSAADVVVFDPERVGPGPERTVDDLPGGAARLYAGATGVEHVLVTGTGVVEGGRLTGECPGVLLRSGRDTETVTVPGRPS
ncbi:MAG TPA: amidohydrolase family protein [Acidimicrobiales bacterium]|nr:amidohydrolase family protein [Acidimicrobiales bacterium]